MSFTMKGLVIVWAWIAYPFCIQKSVDNMSHLPKVYTCSHYENLLEYNIVWVIDFLDNLAPSHQDCSEKRAVYEVVVVFVDV